MATPQSSNIEPNQTTDELTSIGISSSKKIIRKPAIQKSPGNTQTLLGREYEGYIAMFFILRAVLNKYRFKVGVEIEQARKFDDLVFLREDGNELKSRCMQVKHTISEKKKIDSMSLLTVEDSDYSIVKYFFSYRDMLGDDYFKDITQEDLIVYTNCPLDFESSVGAKMVMCDPLMSFDPIDVKGKKLRDLFERITDKDIVLDVNKNESCRYKFNDKLIQILSSKANEYNVSRLAQALKDWLLGNKNLQQVEHVIKPYWRFLTEEVIDVNEKRFRESFLKVNKKVTSKEAQLFNKKMVEEIDRKNKQNKKKDAGFKVDDLSIEHLNKKLNDIEEFPMWESSKRDFKMSEVIKNKEIEAFLGLFVFAANQPNLAELKEIIKQDIANEQRRKYGNDDFHKEDVGRYVEEILNYFHSEVFDWTGKEVVRKKKKEIQIKYKTHENSRELLEWKAIKFNVQDPVESFMGRDEEIESLCTNICRGETVDKQTNVICGLPGMGKSELVRGYVQKHCSRHENKILWINGGSRESMEDSFRRLAKTLSIATTKSDGTLEDIGRIITEVYRELHPKKCLFVFDDAPNLEMIDPFMPKKEHFEGNLPFVVITSSNTKWEIGFKTELDVLTPENAVRLIETQISVKNILETEQVNRLVKFLNFFPLSIQQIAVYIENVMQNDPQFTIEHLLDSFSKNATEILDTKLLEKNSCYEKTTYTNFIHIIETISGYEVIGDLAVRLLYIMSFMDMNNIETSWLQKIFNRNLGETFQLLIQYSIIRIDSGIINIHGLVQLVTRLMMKRKNLEKSYVVITKIFFDVIHPNGNSMDDFAKNKKLIPHLEVFITHIDEIYESHTSDKEVPCLEALLQMLGKSYDKVREYEKGKAIHMRLHLMALKKHGENHIKTVFASINCALGELIYGNYDVAKSILDKAYGVFLKKYGENHVWTVAVLVSLAKAELKLGNYNVAKFKLEKAYAGGLKYYGENHVATDLVLNILALAELKLRNYDVAKYKFEKVYAALLKEYGEHHIETVRVSMYLALIELELGNYDVAKSKCENVYAAHLKYYGENHVDTALALANLALVELQLGSYEVAKYKFEKAYEVLTKKYGENQIDNLNLLANLAMGEIKLGNHCDAKSKLEKVHAVFILKYGEDHDLTVSVLANLASAELKLGNDDVAKSKFEKVYATHQVSV
ncbi:uncharacterized protein LOC143913757 [Arctopsyche grandis]|uniref:uncharacterized protein LOC143913757 n=1 Tax=Arctopsyche grandis TaxID=121162 RepID=UPI00406D873C